MFYPDMTKLLSRVNSRYLLVNVIAHRARELALESELNETPLDKKPVSIAIDEIAAGEIVVDCEP